VMTAGLWQAGQTNWFAVSRSFAEEIISKRN
jgi:hypothetical protein